MTAAGIGACIAAGILAAVTIATIEAMPRLVAASEYAKH